MIVCDGCNSRFPDNGALNICQCNGPLSGSVKGVGTVVTVKPRIMAKGRIASDRAKYILHRQEICYACEQCTEEPRRRCMELVQLGKPGYIMHSRGIPRWESRCPLGKWGPALQLLDKINPPWHYITRRQLFDDVTEMAGKLPPISGIAGVPKSGMPPASWLASLMQLPLYSASVQHGLQPLGEGRRGSVAADSDLPILILDDTVASGSAMRALKAKLPKGNYLFGAVYAEEQGLNELDLFGVKSTLHFLEWNLANSGWVRSLDPQGGWNGAGIATDLDGVYCPDPPWFDEETPAGREAYLEWIANAPRTGFMPRQHKIPLIVSYRCEYARAATEAWLAKHGIQYDELRLWPGQPSDRSFDGLFKAQAYAEKNYGLFIESDEDQAEAIAEATRRRVLCTTLGWMAETGQP